MGLEMEQGREQEKGMEEEVGPVQEQGIRCPHLCHCHALSRRGS